MNILAIILSLHRKNFDDRESLDGEVLDLLENYNLDGDVPSWLVDMLSAVDSRSNCEAQFDQVGSDIGSVLLELSDEFGWLVDDRGEEIRITFPKSNVGVLISREALTQNGVGSCSYRVTTG